MPLVVIVRCEVPDTGRLFYEMETIQLDKPTDLPHAADVVFIIQQAPCNRDLMNKISTVVDGLDKAMRSQGLTSLRYAVVGFGGKQLHLANPHVHTMDGQVFNSANKVSNVTYIVSQKIVQNCFCQNFVKYTPILIIFVRKMAKRLKLCEMNSFSTSPNSRYHTTVLNADVPNCYRMLRVVICYKLSNDLINTQ